MTLHEAIEKLLRQTGRPMTSTEIANELNKNKWYRKKDGSAIDPFQIHGRTRNYPKIFNRNGSMVSLVGQSNVKAIFSQTKEEKPRHKLTEISKDIALLEKVLINEKNFKGAGSIDDLVPDQPGMYFIRINDTNKLPDPFSIHLKSRNHNIIYIGIASQSLNKRFLNQELRANGHGTFFRSIGAILGFRPEKGSLRLKANKRNYKFNPNDEKKIIKWINQNLIVNWVASDEDLRGFETTLIQKHLPLLNIAKNPMALKELSDLRAECVSIANSKP
jgi:hypothetical protein